MKRIFLFLAAAALCPAAQLHAEANSEQSGRGNAAPNADMAPQPRKAASDADDSVRMYRLQEVEVTATRATRNTPVAYSDIQREAIARNVAKDLGDIALPLLPIGLQPFTVAEFFPTPGLSEYYDPRQHAIALCYVVPIAGDCKPQDETLDVEWVDPKSDVMDTFVAQMVNGHGRIVRQALAWAGI